MISVDKFLNQVEKNLNNLVEETLTKKTNEWRKRAISPNVIRTSLATCLRQTYYSYFLRDKRFSKKIDQRGRRTLFLGHQIDELAARLFDNFEGKILRTQDRFPVQMAAPKLGATNIEFAVTTDYVNYRNIGGVKHYIPIEIKSTKHSIETAKSTFRPDERYIRQLLLWIYYAKSNGLNVPFGALIYLSKVDLSTFKLVVMVDSNNPESANNVLWYSDHELDIEKLVSDIRFNITNKVLPRKPSIGYRTGQLPPYICSDCPFKSLCDTHTNVDEVTKYEQ